MSSAMLEAGLSEEVLEVHRALASLQEELEAIDYYHQRAAVTEDAGLRATLAHNRDDEMEHAAMLLEWLRGALPGLDAQLRKFLFKPEALPGLAARPEAQGLQPEIQGAGLGLGNLR
jgi:hypothetical protein